MTAKVCPQDLSGRAVLNHVLALLLPVCSSPRLASVLQFKPISGFIYVRVAEVCLPPSGSLLPRSPFM